MQSDGWVLLFQRVKTKIAEIDLIFELENEMRLIEVKTLDQAWRSFQRINANQVNKLLQNQIYFSQKYRGRICRAQICWVLQNEIQFVDVN